MPGDLPAYNSPRVRRLSLCPGIASEALPAGHYQAWNARRPASLQQPQGASLTFMPWDSKRNASRRAPSSRKCPAACQPATTPGCAARLYALTKQARCFPQGTIKPGMPGGLPACSSRRVRRLSLCPGIASETLPTGHRERQVLSDLPQCKLSTRHT